MRIRNIKPRFWRSDDIDALEWHDRLLFIGLWSYVDDNGVGIDKLSSIAADLFAADLVKSSEETLKRISSGLERLSSSGLIQRYQSEGRNLLYVTNWKLHQKVTNPNTPRYSTPTSANTDPGKLEDSPSRDNQENLPTGVEVHSCSGVEIPEESRNLPAVPEDVPEAKPEKKPTTPDSTNRFDEFWATYPRREGKGAARTAYEKALKKTDAETIIDAAARYGSDPNRSKKFTKHPSTWLNQECWEDEPLPEDDRPQNGTPSIVDTNQNIFDAVSRIEARTNPNPTLGYQWEIEA